METLQPQCESETPPRTDTIPGSFPEENRNGSTCNTCYGTSKDEEASEGLGRRVYCSEDAEFEDEYEANERKGIESNEKKGRPA